MPAELGGCPTVFDSGLPDHTAERPDVPRDAHGIQLALHAAFDGECLWCEKPYPCPAVQAGPQPKNGEKPRSSPA